MITKTISAFRKVWLLAAAVTVTGSALAQDLDPAELEELVAPIALYPDDVLGIILPAATFPIDIVEAARFLEDLEENPSLEPDPAWDDSIVALLNYPEVVQMMNEDLDWTWALGEAVLIDQQAVLDAAQRFRGEAYAAGNLRSDERQIVSNQNQVIEIRPADPEVIYIPVYEPREVIVYQRAPVIYYYPIAYPVYYYPYPVGYSFAVDYFWGVTSWFSVGWNTHHLHVLHHTDRLHPYYLNSYYFYTDYYPRSRMYVTVNVNNYTNVWTPSPRRSGNRPRTITTESRTSSVRTGRTSTVETQPGVSGSTRATTSTSTSSSLSRSQSRSQSGNTERATTTRAIESPPVTSSTRSARTNESTATTGSIASAPETRGQSATRSQPQGLTQPSTRSQQVTPSTRSQATPAPRSSVSAQSQGSSTRRSNGSSAPAVTSPPPVSSAPQVSTPAPVYSPPPSSSRSQVSTPAPVYSPPPSQSSAPSTRSSQSSAPRQGPSDNGSSSRTRMR